MDSVSPFLLENKSMNLLIPLNSLIGESLDKIFRFEDRSSGSSEEGEELDTKSFLDKETSFNYTQNLELSPIDDFSREKYGRRRKRRCINPKNMPEIRILRRDIRRSYGEMFSNVLNNHDPDLYQKFIDEFFRPDCKVIRSLQPHEVTKAFELVVFNKCRNGLEEMMLSYLFCCEIMPDSIVQMQECQVRVRQGVKGSLVMTKSVFTRTRLFIVEATDTANDSQKDPSLPSSKCIEANHYRKDFIFPPSGVISEHVMVMVLDEMHRIREFHIEGLSVTDIPATY